MELLQERGWRGWTQLERIAAAPNSAAAPPQPGQDARHLKPDRVHDQHRQDHEPERDPLARRPHGPAPGRRRDAQRRAFLSTDQRLPADAPTHRSPPPARPPPNRFEHQNCRSRRTEFRPHRHPSSTGLGTSSPSKPAPPDREGNAVSEKPPPWVKIRVSQGARPPPPASAHGATHSDSTHHPSAVHLLLRPGPEGAPSPRPDTAHAASVVLICLTLCTAQDRSRSRGTTRRRLPPSWR